MAKAFKRRPPSRIKYEQGHPTVSCRVSREIYDRLVEAKEVEGKSFADILKIGLGKQEVQAKKVGEAKKQGLDEGYKKGYAEAELLFKVTFPCSVCGKPLSITSEKGKKAAAEHMTGEGWGHAECHERKRNEL